MKKITYLLFFILVYFSLSWYFSNLILLPDSSIEKTKKKINKEWGTTFNAMLELLPPAEDFHLYSFDNTLIKGKYFKKKEKASCAIVLLHGWADCWAGVLKYVPVLKNCACDLVIYDHRKHGESSGEYATGGIKESKDLLYISNWLEVKKGFQAKEIGWLGESWGASTALMAGAEEKNVGFIIADAPFQDWHSAISERAVRDYGTWIKFMFWGVFKIVNWRAGINYSDASVWKIADKIEEPVLLLHSQTDQETNSQQSVNIVKKLHKNTTFHHLNWGGGHTKDVLVNKKKFQKLIEDFLKEKTDNFLKK